MVIKKARKNLTERRLRILNREFFRLAEDVRKIKEHSIENLEYLIDTAVKNLEKNGFEVYFAKNVREGQKVVLDFFEDSSTVLKAKSMVSHELDLNSALSEKGIEVWETDLGELVIQMLNERPRHMTMPAIHIKAEEAFKVLGVQDFEGLKAKVRKLLREKLARADGGITGANVISSDGSLFIIENEGNARLVSALPEKVMTVTGVEKIVDSFSSAVKVSEVIWKSAGYYSPSYLNVISGISKSGDIEKRIIKGLHGPSKHAILFLDNGRMKARDSAFKETLYCVRCGACQFSCPSYEALNADWGTVYSGGIGAVWNYITGSESNPFYCLNCGACVETCPLRIDVPEMLRKLKMIKIGKIN
ncbi:LUD domain-containing protein [Geoglobus acetivorans]|uniref:LUD domain-containing protein n=1 Tax=Geoglobus acetivorans TaxID=565033 RepID=UPI0006932B19